MRQVNDGTGHRISQATVRLQDGAHAALTCWDGPEPRIVALHGLAHAGAAWSGFAAAIGGRAEVVAVDLRGHGDSDRDPTGLYTLETLVEDAIAVLQSLGGERPVLVGHSLGGRIVAEIALQDLAALAGAVVVDSSPQPPEAWLAHLERLHERPPARAASFAEHLQRLAELYPLANREDLRPLAAASARSGAGGLEAGGLDAGGLEEKVDRAALRVWSTERVRAPWPGRTGRTPLILVRGVASSVLTRAAAARLLASRQVDDVVEIARSGHGVPLENPAALAEAVLSIVTSPPPTSAPLTSRPATSPPGTSPGVTTPAGTS